MFVGGRGGPTLPEGRPAPELTVTSTDGEFDLGAQRGQVVVLAFWATWCPACRAEGPTLSRVHEQIRGAGDLVLGVSVDVEPLPQIERAARRLGMSYPIARVARTDVERFQVDLLPTIYVIGPDGSISQSFTGAVGEARLLQAVRDARARHTRGNRPGEMRAADETRGPGQWARRASRTRMSPSIPRRECQELGCP